MPMSCCHVQRKLGLLPAGYKHFCAFVSITKNNCLYWPHDQSMWNKRFLCSCRNLRYFFFVALCTASSSSVSSSSWFYLTFLQDFISHYALFKSRISQTGPSSSLEGYGAVLWCHEQRPSLGSFAVILRYPSVTICWESFEGGHGSWKFKNYWFKVSQSALLL